MIRKMTANWKLPEKQWNITTPLPPDNSPITLNHWSGKWTHVKYNSATIANQKSVIFDGDIQGIYTTGLADCVCVIICAGRRSKYQGDYYSASLTRLPGGDASTCDWEKFLNGTGYTKSEINKGCRNGGGWWCHAIMAGNADNWLVISIVQAITKVLVEKCGFTEECITAYLGRVQLGFGFHRKGWFGVPTSFGDYT